MYVISLEAINFQPASAPKNLANEMTALFQETIDYRNTVKESDSERIKAVYDYFVKKVAPRLLQTIHKYTGIKLSAFVPKYLMCNFAIAMEFENDPISAENIIRRYSGLLDNKDYPSFLRHNCKVFKTNQQLEEFAGSLDKTTGMVAAGMMEKHHFKGKLYFDCYSAFLIKETGARACEPFTAQEITAIILHEIGHDLSFIEHAADMVFKKDMMDTTVKLFTDNAPLEEQLKYASKLVGAVHPKGVEQLNKIQEYVKTNKPKEGSIIYSSIMIVLRTILATLNTLGFTLLGIVTSTIKNTWNASIGGIYKSIRSIDEYKTGDFANTPMNHMYCEVLADEYVTRFGYGLHLAKLLDKLTSWARLTLLGDMYMKQSSSASMFGRMLPWTIYTLYFGDKYSLDYPTEKHRYELLMLDTLKAFKSANLNEELLADYYNAYNTIKKMLDNPSSLLKYTTACNYLHDAIKYIVQTPAELLFSGRFDREYERLYNQVQLLSNNEMYAVAYKLRTMNKGN